MTALLAFQNGLLVEISQTDTQKVAADKAVLTWAIIKGSNVAQNNVTSNLTLPALGASGSAITWVSSDPITISTTGAVTRPAYASGNKIVTLTAKITSGDVSDTVTFTLTVIAQPSPSQPSDRPSGGGSSTSSGSGNTSNIGVTSVPSGNNSSVGNTATIPGITTPQAIEWQNPYSDVAYLDWFYDAVRFVTERGLMNGTDTNKFSPNTTMTRAMLVTTLYRLEGKPTVSGSAAFTDVKTGEWYSDAILWASQNNIAEGYANGTFGWNDSVTREQTVTILYRYAQSKGLVVSSEADLSKYTDKDQISDWRFLL